MSNLTEGVGLVGPGSAGTKEALEVLTWGTKLKREPQNSVIGAKNMLIV